MPPRPPPRATSPPRWRRCGPGPRSSPPARPAGPVQGSPPAATARTTSGRSPPGSPPSSPSGRSGSPPPPGSGSGSRPAWCGSPPARPTTCCAMPRPSSTSPRAASACRRRTGRGGWSPSARPEGAMHGFAHLHVASGFSMRYGASMPEDLVERAAGHGQGALALTDRDGLYGAVRFATACGRAGIAPVLGVDLAVEPLAIGAVGGVGHGPDAGRPRPRSRTPARGGAIVDPRRPRVTVLARGRGGGTAPGVGWAALCRLVTETHLRGERGVPVTSPDLLATWSHPADHEVATGKRGEPSRLLVLLGPDSDVGRAVLAGRRERARDLLAAWQALLPRDGLAVEIVHHGGPEGTPGCRSHAAHLLALADAAGLPAVLSAAVRHADPEQVRTVDLLDAARRLVVLDSRHLDRVTDAGHLASTAAMHASALEVTGGDRSRADRLVAMTSLVADECTQQARPDLGIGAVHLPEAEVLGITPGTEMQVLAQRCRDAVGRRYPGASDTEQQVVLARLDDELAVIDTLGYPTYFLTVAEVTDLIRARGVRVAARGSGAGSLVNHLLGISGDDPIR